ESFGSRPYSPVHAWQPQLEFALSVSGCGHIDISERLDTGEACCMGCDNRDGHWLTQIIDHNPEYGLLRLTGYADTSCRTANESSHEPLETFDGVHEAPRFHGPFTRSVASIS